MTKIKELREVAPEDLKAKEKALKKELFELKYQRKIGGRAEKPHRFRLIRRDIAKIMTVTNERAKNAK